MILPASMHANPGIEAKGVAGCVTHVCYCAISWTLCAFCVDLTTPPRPNGNSRCKIFHARTEGMPGGTVLMRRSRPAVMVRQCHHTRVAFRERHRRHFVCWSAEGWFASNHTRLDSSSTLLAVHADDMPRQKVRSATVGDLLLVFTALVTQFRRATR